MEALETPYRAAGRGQGHPAQHPVRAQGRRALRASAVGVAVASAIAARDPRLRDAVPEMCVRAHEKAVTDAGLTPEHVNDAVRIAATLYAVSLEMD